MQFDITMPIFLFLLCFASIKIYKKFEDKLKQILEEKEFQIKDVIVLVAVMGVMISIMVLVPSLALTVIILFAFSMLLFTFSLIATEKWYISIIPPIVFILLYCFGVFLNIPYLWNSYITNIFATLFAIMITVYVGGLFTWKTTAIFAVLLTAIDIVHVFLTGHMVKLAEHAIESKLPLLVSLPVLPPIYTEKGLAPTGLGLGDLFFAGMLSIQTFKEMNRKYALYSILGISISYFIFEALLLTYRIAFFPGTLVIICGWFPVILVQKLREKTFKAV